MPAWSYSSLTSFETCPRRHYILRVSKQVAEPESEEQRWGNAVHKALEDRVGKKTPLPPGMEKFEKFAAPFDSAAGEVFTETKIALTKNLEPTTWFGKDVWVRCIVDVGTRRDGVATALDWKTGKPKPDSDQLRLFAAAIMHKWPEVNKVSTGFVWLAYNKLTKDVFTREQLGEIWSEFSPRVARLDTAAANNSWPPKPSGLCAKWCPVGKSRCEFCGK